jgi:hypothetical protein
VDLLVETPGRGARRREAGGMTCFK